CINNLQRIVTQGGKNQQPAFGVCREVIDAPGDIRHGNSLNELQWRKLVWCRGRCVRSRRATAPGQESDNSKREETEYRRDCLHIFLLSDLPSSHGCGSKTRIAASSLSFDGAAT